MVGYSRGGGGMAAVGNALRNMGISVDKMADVDGKLGRSGNMIDSTTATLRVFRPDKWSLVQMLAPMVGLHGSIFQGRSNTPIDTSGWFDVSHGGIDEYGKGPLGTVQCWFFGSNP